MELTKKFQIELDNFKKWFYENYKVEELLNVNYQEPSRNKLQKYISEMLKENKVYNKNGKIVSDSKLLLNDYKNNKKNNKKNNLLKSIKNLDTSNTVELKKLDFNTSELSSVFGKLVKTGRKKDFWENEWKFKYKMNVYSIYDRKDNNWYLAGTSDEFVQEIIDIIKQILNDQNSIKPNDLFEELEINFDEINISESYKENESLVIPDLKSDTESD